MISFKPTEEEQSFSQLAKTFALEKIRPVAREIEYNRHVSEDLIYQTVELGFTALELPETWEGLEMPLISQVQIWEALATGDLGVLQGLPGYSEAATFIRLDSENSVFTSLKLEKIPNVSFVHDRDQAFTVVESEQDYIVNGISNPVKMALTANFIILASTDLKGQPILFLLTEDQWKTIKGEYRLGLLAAGCAKVQLDHVRVSKKQVIALGDQANRLLDEALARLRVIEAAKEVGLMSAALSYATGYTTERKAFGSEIAKFQGVSFTVAQMAMHTNAARNLVWYAASQIDQHERNAKDCSLIALHNAHKSLRFVTDAAVQLLGGHGYVQDHPVEKWMRDAEAQVHLWEAESDLLLQSGEFLQRGQVNDHI